MGTDVCFPKRVFQKFKSFKFKDLFKHRPSCPFRKKPIEVQPVEVDLPEKSVVAHFMMGLTSTYQQSDFEWDINNAIIYGFDGFALNFGNDDWMMDKLKLMYDAADAVNKDFKLYLMLDMAAMGSVSADVATNYVKTFAKRSHQATIDGKIVVGTFSGESINFGQSSVNDGWQTQFKDALASAGINIFFIPCWSLDASTIYEKYTVADCFLKWNCWPYYSGSPMSDSEDQVYMQHAKGNKKKYMGAVSPCMFTHFSDKNFVFFSEGLWYTRWLQMIKLQPNYLQVVTWNDYGESHYIGPTNNNAAFPVSGSNSHEWVDQFTHVPLAGTLPYFIQMYKQGTTDLPSNFNGPSTLFFTYRIHSKNAKANGDSIGQPENYQNSKDEIDVIAFSKSSFSLKVSVNGTVLGTVNMQAGVTSNSFSFVVNDKTVAGLPLFQIYEGSSEVSQATGPLSILADDKVTQYNFNLCCGSLNW
ncbi:glucan endo-1,3-alpha-glucosidase Agn2 [Schizosaccharomyces cryophilus OY26]|uniref:Glucan endo-1,3-alpha-glucosidase Agn2 n=1 Tax=Schizosaccharomyces cryophilus (strain OY26 / ATCC MYA-4695 / CBS 11777 / NBRC 106824 / NRRL Y48691) TaxID=653667 RepID=S9W6Y7_SCHCR|nr:glucan endo-1,3-alpha-glucosidase Agn2 [Schizosaccharomyces cryophilus OY26]EPY54294.1 glucan endo-1,3-alpha-glucosidase Agn2 [Schizosaccharomyces cryophilus OY26]